MRDCLTTTQAAAHLGVTTHTVRNWLARGLLPSHRHARSLCLFASEVARYRVHREEAMCLTQAALAAHYQVSRRTIHRWLTAGRWPTHQHGARRCVSRSALNEEAPR